MTLSSDIQRLIERLNQELDNIEREATEKLPPDDVTSEEVQEAGEELSTLKGRIIEIKTLVSSTIPALERLQ